MIELLRIIRDYQQKKKLRKLLKGRIFLKMKDKIEIKDNQYIINGQVLDDKVLIDEMFKWSMDNFVFRNNDVFLPTAPARPLMNNTKNLLLHQDLDVQAFAQKYGNYALKYLLYNAFITGYEAGKEEALVNQDNTISEKIDELVEESQVVEPVKEEPVEVEEEAPLEEAHPVHTPRKKKKKKSSSPETKNDITPSEKKEEPITEDIKEAPEEDFMNPPTSSTEEDDTIESVATFTGTDLEKYVYDKDGNLLISSDKYKFRTYEKYICNVIEQRLSIYGLKPVDLLDKKFPTYYLGEVLLDITNADAINPEQEHIKQVFYDYIKQLQEDVTKVNTTT